MSDLEDYGALLRSGQAAVPDYAADEARKQLLSLQRAQEQRLTAEANREAQEQQGFQADLTTVLAHPSAQGYSALIAKHPKFAQQVKSSWDLLDKNRQDGDLQAMSEIYSAAANGKNDLAAGLMKRRIEADRAAGQDTTHDQAILDALSSGDPVQQKGALGMIGVTLSAVTGPEKFEQTLGQLTKGTTPDIRNVNAGDDVISIDPNTHQATSIYKSPYVKTADGGILERDGTGGGDPASPGAAPTTAPGAVRRTHGYTPRERDGGDNPDHVVDNKIAALSSAVGVDPDAPMNPQQFAAFARALPATEGGAGTLSGQQNNPGALKDGAFAKAQPGYAGAKNGYAVFSDSASGTAAMQKLLTNRFYNQGQRSIRDIIEGRPAGTSTGGASSAAAPATDGAPPGYHWLTPPKPKDAPSGYRYKPDGSLEAIPGGPADPDGVKNAGPLKPDALRTATVSYIKTGKMPAGMGGQALKNQILNYVPQIMEEQGLTPDDMPSIQQQFQADSAAFKQRVGQLSYMHQSVGKLNQHAQDLSALIKAIPLQGNFAPFNWITQGAEGSVSNSTIAQLRGGLPLFESEVARVMTGNPNTGSGQLSDDARHEFDILHSSQAPKAKIDAMNRIMKMVEESVKATRDETGSLKSRIGGGIDVYAGNGGPKEQTQPANQQEWITLPSGLKIRKIK